MPGRRPEPMREREASLGPADPPEGHGGVDDRKAAAEGFPAWEQIEAGRYMPRRTRGSFPGRELG
jgi:hypothetical protein